MAPAELRDAEPLGMVSGLILPPHEAQRNGERLR
jgi:hypothetical protein